MSIFTISELIFYSYSSFIIFLSLEEVIPFLQFYQETARHSVLYTKLTLSILTLVRVYILHIWTLCKRGCISVLCVFTVCNIFFFFFFSQFRHSPLWMKDSPACLNTNLSGLSLWSRKHF